MRATVTWKIRHGNNKDKGLVTVKVGKGKVWSRAYRTESAAHLTGLRLRFILGMTPEGLLVKQIVTWFESAYAGGRAWNR
jgi:hypothetical protein